MNTYFKTLLDQLNSDVVVDILSAGLSDCLADK